MRSASHYTPIDTFHLVVADHEGRVQIPQWLDPSEGSLRLVAHSDILEGEYLPTFQSQVIESALHLIHNLARPTLFI